MAGSDLAHGRRACRVAVVVDEDGERDALVVDERLGVAGVAGADGDDVAAAAVHRGVLVAQLRGVLTAQQSAEVPEEHHDHGPLGPEVAQPVAAAVGAVEHHVGEPLQIHGRPHYRCLSQEVAPPWVLATFLATS